MLSRSKVAVLAVTAGLLTACGGGTEPTEPAASSTPHGYVEGAEETAEAQSKLLLADAESGAVRVLDLLSEEVTELDDVQGVGGISTDGRFGFLTAGDTTTVVDTGSWMVDHGDHVHYYRAEIRKAGELDGNTIAAHSDSAITATPLSNGTTALLDTEALADGETKLDDPVAGIAVPYAQHLVVASEDQVEVRDRKGGSAAEIDESCAEPKGSAVTGRGAVLGCADGALLVHEEDERFAATKIPYPRSVSATERAAEFAQRPGSETLAATAGGRGFWALNTTEREWTFVAERQVVAVNAVGAGGPLLALTSDGVLHAYDPATGEQTASRELLSEGVPDGASPTIQVDTSRAYVNDAAGSKVYEIDYTDELRVARTFDLDIKPSYLVETGR
ncbi:hypothetical protein EV191_103290 [Tamaricihabitans halophyticus]|uniref:ABC transporter n=1 Tax=Tamaricihabitans halophyticus TaxID=1262583 RepID=A0A4V2SUE4_9PSEU|nr:PQQ-like beta-propeller repeat protein [Tamaricihabitans halophyticus]TCP54246.1 hypothetical protein EV191_103290 [Tamaricihabitans halophyticus]